MNYKPSDIEPLVEIFHKCHAAKDNLEHFLSPVAQDLGFQDVVIVEVTEDAISFTAEWFGSYQAHDKEVFEFPISLLVEGKDQIVAHLKQKIEEENQRKKAQSDKTKEILELDLLRKLKDKYEKVNVTLTACDKDSSAGYVKILSFKDRADFLEQYNEFKEAVPFARWYVEAESEETETENLVESWLDWSIAARSFKRFYNWGEENDS